MLDSNVRRATSLWEQRARDEADEIEKEKSLNPKRAEGKEKRNSLSATRSIALESLTSQERELQLDAVLSPRHKRKRSISFTDKKTPTHSILSPRKQTNPNTIQNSHSEPELSKMIEESLEEEKKVHVKLKKKEKEGKEKENETVTKNPLGAFKVDGHFEKLDIKRIKGLHTSKEHTLVALKTNTRTYELDVLLTDLLLDRARLSKPSFPSVTNLDEQRKHFWLNIEGKSNINLLELFQCRVLLPESVKYVNALKNEFYEFKELKKKKGIILSPLFDRLENLFNRLVKQSDSVSSVDGLKIDEEQRPNYSEFMRLHQTISKKNMKISEQIRKILEKILPKSKTLNYLRKWNIPETIPFDETSGDSILFHSMSPKSVKQSFFRYGEIVPNIYLNGHLLFKAGQKADEFKSLETLFTQLHESYKKEHLDCYQTESQDDILKAQVKLFMLLSDEEKSANEKFKELFSQKRLDFVEIQKFFDSIEEFKSCPINWKKVSATTLKDTELRPYAVLRQLIPAFSILQVTSVTSIYKVKDVWCKGLESEKKKYDIKFVNLEDNAYDNTWKIHIARNQFFVKKLFQLGVYPMQVVSGMARPDKTTKLATFFLKFFVQSINSKLLYTDGEIHCSRLELTPNAIKPDYKKIVASFIKHLTKIPETKNVASSMKIFLAE